MFLLPLRLMERRVFLSCLRRAAALAGFGAAPVSATCHTLPLSRRLRLNFEATTGDTRRGGWASSALAFRFAMAWQWRSDPLEGYPSGAGQMMMESCRMHCSCVPLQCCVVGGARLEARVAGRRIFEAALMYEAGLLT